MSDLDVLVKPRRVVYDVARPEQQVRSRKKRRGHGKKQQGVPPAKFTQQPVLSLNEDDQQRLPLEMAPLIQAAIEYGRKTHALGALKTAQALANIVAKLKKIEHPLVLDVITEAELESRKIFTLFNIAYNEPDVEV